ncbi:S9 family peptidase [Marinobacterium sp. AK62]|uniref:S9 family peptidase n=1 Tax=Marinobacterium alkalitolerans TaxID=1542925 RepID=A0ABS3ZEP3_9GAMM|nr:prolyl oligopeptidase family serine peptidase [Marinobacterium alkalitolerans]MBP0050170.1 S9 family peptidase [Marinobacterium alkalitolerans]
MSATHVYSPAAEPALSAEAAVAAMQDYAALRWYRGQVLGVCFEASTGRNRLCRFDQGRAQSLLPDRFSVRSRVHEYGGGAWCLAGDQACFVNDTDQQIWMLPLDTQTEPEPLTRQQKMRFADLQPDSARQRLIAVSELHGDGEPENSLVSVCLQSGEVTSLATGTDFYSSPRLSPDGHQLAWIEWDHPQQPWRSTRLMRAQLCSKGKVQRIEQLSDICAAWAQPQFSPSGILHAVVDRNDWWRIEVYGPEGWQPLTGNSPERTEFTTAPWQFGLSTYGWSDSGELLALGQCEGYSRLWCHTGTEWRAVDLNLLPSRLHALAVEGDQLACVAEFSDRLPAILSIHTELTPDDPDQCVRLLGGQPPAYTPSLPYSKSTLVDGISVPYFLYRPAGAPADTALPLAIWTHGGPTAATAPVLKPAIQFWTQRGFMIADINYRGSTGYGRHYRMALAGQWGQSDVADVEAIAQDLIQQGMADPRAIFIRGNSAGGYTTLSALCHSRLFTGGASLYGVSDPARLNRLTHKFESRYLHWLIGDPDTRPDLYQARSPLQQAHRIRVPVIFFQGAQDKVVLPEQTAQMAERLKLNGVPVETHLFKDEAHGFRQPRNQSAVLEAELAFYRRLMGA